MTEHMKSTMTRIPARRQKIVPADVQTAQFRGKDQQHQPQEDQAHVPYLPADHPLGKHTGEARQIDAGPVHHQTTLTDGQHTPEEEAALRMTAHSQYTTTEKNKEAQRIHLPCAGAPISTGAKYNIISSLY